MTIKKSSSFWRLFFLGLLALIILAVGMFWLVPKAPLEAEIAEPVIDMHTHVAGLGLQGSDNFINPTLLNSYKFNFYLNAFGVTNEELQQHGDKIVVQRLAEGISESREVDKAVVLALDGVIDENGELDRQKTQVYVSNEFLIDALQPYDQLLFGASINPYRKDALERLDRVAEAGAVLIKWIPSIMDIDPSDARILPFYQRMIALDLPLLIHVGDENAFAGADNLLGDPNLLNLPIQAGVKVIAGHVATTGSNSGEDNMLRLLRMMKKNDKIYSDISSLTQINKRAYLPKVIAEKDIYDNLVYGSDWPLQFSLLVSPWYQFGRLSPAEIKALNAIENPWDRDIALKRAMGFPDSVFTNSAKVLNQ